MLKATITVMMADMQTEHPFHILVVEDDKSLADWIQEYLTNQGYRVSVVNRGDTAVAQITSIMPDLVVLDGMLPGLDGLDVCKAVRPDYSGPIVMLTARDEEIDEVLGLEVGADDYLTKPVKPRILLARIKTLLRRHSPASPAVGQRHKIVLSGLSIDQSSRVVTLDNKAIKISSNEFDVLWLLAEKAGQLVTRDELVTKLRGFEYDGFDRSIDLRVSRLRKKLGDDPAEPYRIKTIWGKGYLFAKDGW